MAEQFIGRLVRAIDINYSVHALLQRSHTPVADMSAVVVITEEDCAADVILRTDYRVVRS